MKSLDEFVALFAEQFDETDPSEIKAGTCFRDLNDWSSLVALSIIAMIDEEFGISLDSEVFKKSKTVEELYNNLLA